MSIVFPLHLQPTTAKSGGMFKNLVGKAMVAAGVILVQNQRTTRCGARERANAKTCHVELQLGVKPLVLHIDQQLKARGIKTWIDEYDMGKLSTFQSTMAVEGASHVLVFLTQKYKESGNCRRECEYADTAEIPIIVYYGRS